MHEQVSGWTTTGCSSWSVGGRCSGSRERPVSSDGPDVDVPAEKKTRVELGATTERSTRGEEEIGETVNCSWGADDRDQQSV